MTESLDSLITAQVGDESHDPSTFGSGIEDLHRQLRFDLHQAPGLQLSPRTDQRLPDFSSWVPNRIPGPGRARPIFLHRAEKQDLGGSACRLPPSESGGKNLALVHHQAITVGEETHKVGEKEVTQMG
jgi:hypothetical protein